jgi:hypothetical protein
VRETERVRERKLDGRTHRRGRFNELEETRRQDAPDGCIVRVDLLSPRKHLFRHGDAIAHRLRLTDRYRRRKSSVRKRPLNGTDPIERVSDQVETVNLHHDSARVGQEQAEDRTDASTKEGDAM